jgi:hypothetical protein
VPSARFDIRWLDSDTVELNALRSRAPAGRRIELYEWDFGDGSRASHPVYTIQHRYEQPGRYVISLTVHDNAGLAYSAQREIVVVPDGEVSYEILRSALYSRVYMQTGAIARNPAQLQRLWIEAFGGLNEDDGPPEVDFTSKMIVALFLGSRAAPGYYIRVDRLRVHQGRLEIWYTEIHRVAGPGCATLPVTTSPFVVLKVERVDLPAIYFYDTGEEYFVCR